MFKNPHGTHSVRMTPESSLLWQEKMSTARNRKCQAEVEQGLSWREECRRQGDKPACGVFLLMGEILAFWDPKSNTLWPLSETSSDSSSKQCGPEMT